jgi:DNA processing protein
MELTAEEEQICQLLSRQESMQVNNLSVELNIPVTDLFLTLLELEVKNVVKALPGGVYQLA